MARDSRWHTGWILSFLVLQFVFALVVLALNSDYWARYGGVVHSQLIPAFETEPAFEQNVEQVTKPLNIYIFAISSSTIFLAVLETIAYFANILHPALTILINIALFLAWGGCLAVYFVWGGGLRYTGAAWLSQYHQFCNLHEPEVVSSVSYIYTVTCGGEKILIKMLPFICLNILLPPLFSLYALIALILHHRRKSRHQPPYPPYPPYPPQQPPPPTIYPPISTPASPPLIHQGVLYHPVGMAPVPQQQQHQQQQAPQTTELSGHGAPMQEMTATGTTPANAPASAGNYSSSIRGAELGGGDVRELKA